MSMAEEREIAIPVKDRVNDMWTTIIAIAAITTIPLIGVIGGQILSNMDKIVDTQLKTLKSVSEINGSLKAYDGRISRNEVDIKEIHMHVDKNTQRISKLEGESNGK